MASNAFMPPNPSLRHGSRTNYSGKMVPRSHSFGQVCLPKKTENSSSKFSFTASHTAPESMPSTKTTATSTSSTSSLWRNWREVQGCNNWEGLVEPLHPLLRREIIRYGEFVSACYKAFDLDPTSKRYFSCKYAKKNILKEVGLEDSGYQVTKYIYATPDVSVPLQNESACGRWIGYVAVSSDDDAVTRLGRRDILVTFRGTVTHPEWIANLMSSLTPARLDPHNPRQDVKVVSGLLSLYTSDESEDKFGLESCREQLLSEITRLLNKYKDEDLSISLAGHSMGSSLANLLAYDIAELGLNKLGSDQLIPLTVFSFAGPRVGNSGFKDRCEELGVKVLRIVNVNDPITKLPGVFLNENCRVLGGKYEFPWSCSCYEHVGVELTLDFFNMQNPSSVHDLETSIGLLRRPQKVQTQDDDDKVDHFDRAKELVFRAQNFNKLPLKNAASNLKNLVQSQRNQFLINHDCILGLMNSLALCTFL